MRNSSIIYTLYITFFIFFIIFDFDVTSGLSRGGGSRGSGGGYRSGSGSYRSGSGSYRSGSGSYRSGSGSYRSGSGSYRSGSGSKTQVKVKVKIESKTKYGSGYRSGSYGRIGYSTRYNSWSSSHGFQPSFRYRSSSYVYKSRGIALGLIIMSHRRRSTFIVNRESSYNDISICYNEFPLYDRNISASPWFVCPWDDLDYRYCCGDELQERCCSYYERPGHLAGLIIGLLILLAIVVSSVICCCCYCRSRSHKSNVTLVYTTPNPNINETKQEQSVLMNYPGQDQHDPLIQTDNCPPYPQINQPNPICPPYPTGYDCNSPPQPQPNIPYPPPNEYGQGAPPYPVGYEQPNPYNQQIPPGSSNYSENSLPSYSEVAKNHY